MSRNMAKHNIIRSIVVTSKEAKVTFKPVLSNNLYESLCLRFAAMAAFKLFEREQRCFKIASIFINLVNYNSLKPTLR
jgi:hypothetical protein